MEKRNITLTLSKAKEFYNSDNADLKEIALQAFTEDELTDKGFKRFKSWEDINKYLFNKGIYFNSDAKDMTIGQTALFKLTYIKKILNIGHTLNFTDGVIWYPWIKLVKVKCNYPYYDEELLLRGETNKIGTIKYLSNGDNYDVFAGDVSCTAEGMGNFFYGKYITGSVNFDAGVIGCASKEIAEHMSKYFAKEIFEAMYADYVDYEWIDII